MISHSGERFSEDSHKMLKYFCKVLEFDITDWPSTSWSFVVVVVVCLFVCFNFGQKLKLPILWLFTKK